MNLKLKTIWLFLLVIAVVGAGWYVWGSQSMIVTHYPELGGMQAAPMDELTPSFGDANNQLNDYMKVERFTLNEAVQVFEDTTGSTVRILQAWDVVEAGASDIQIVNNVPIGNSLYTIFLPPGWNPELNLPIILSGNGGFTSNNQRLYVEKDNTLLTMVAVSVRDGGQGLIAAMSNSGGTESLGIDPATMNSVAEFFEWIDQRGGDKHQAITWGSSRGGTTALYWAANPLGLDYTVEAAFAVNPALKPGTMSQISPYTHPALLGLFQSGLDLEAWTGTGDPTAADALLVSPEFVDMLAGKQVVVAGGTHDAFYPAAFLLEFDGLLLQAGIEHTTILSIGGGHQPNPRVVGLVVEWVRSLTSGEAFVLEESRVFTLDNSPEAGHYNQSPLEVDQMPVFVTFPAFMAVGEAVDIWLCGEPGTEIELISQTSDGTKTLFDWFGTIPEEACVDETIPAPVAEGQYWWILEVNGEDRYTSSSLVRNSEGCDLPAITKVVVDMDDVENLFAFNGQHSYGMTTIANQPETCYQ